MDSQTTQRCKCRVDLFTILSKKRKNIGRSPQCSDQLERFLIRVARYGVPRYTLQVHPVDRIQDVSGKRFSRLNDHCTLDCARLAKRTEGDAIISTPTRKTIQS
jgi:hypothetical protein